MTTRRTPDGQVYTEVPVVPRHDQLDGRSLGNSHPISAITGLQEALDSKADAVDGGNLVTDEEKARIETMEANAQENVVEVVKVNGTALVPDASKAVDVTVPTAYGKSISYSGSSGKLSLKGPTGSTLSEVTMPRKGLTSMALNSDTKALTATLQDGSTVSVDISAAADPYTAGNGLALADGAFSLSSQTQGLMEDLADHLSDQAAHVSAADRASWEGVASGAVRTTGAQTIAGAKTFSSPVTVGTPTAVSHAATKQYVDSKDESAVHVTGDETVAGAKTFGSRVAVETSDEDEPTLVRSDSTYDADSLPPVPYTQPVFPLAEARGAEGKVIGRLYIQAGLEGTNWLIYEGRAITPDGPVMKTQVLARLLPHDE